MAQDPAESCNQIAAKGYYLEFIIRLTSGRVTEIEMDQEGESESPGQVKHVPPILANNSTEQTGSERSHHGESYSVTDGVIVIGKISS